MTAVLSGTTAKEVAGVNKIATTGILKEQTQSRVEYLNSLISNGDKLMI